MNEYITVCTTEKVSENYSTVEIIARENNFQGHMYINTTEIIGKMQRIETPISIKL